MLLLTLDKLHCMLNCELQVITLVQLLWIQIDRIEPEQLVLDQLEWRGNNWIGVVRNRSYD